MSKKFTSHGSAMEEEKKNQGKGKPEQQKMISRHSWSLKKVNMRKKHNAIKSLKGLNSLTLYWFQWSKRYCRIKVPKIIQNNNLEKLHLMAKTYVDANCWKLNLLNCTRDLKSHKPTQVTMMLTSSIHTNYLTKSTEVWMLQ